MNTEMMLDSLFIIIILNKVLNPVTAGSARINVKENKKGGRKKIRVEVQRVKHPTRFQAIDAVIGDE